MTAPYLESVFFLLCRGDGTAGCVHGGVPHAHGLGCLDDPATHRQQEVQFVLGDRHRLSRHADAVRTRRARPLRRSRALDLRERPNGAPDLECGGGCGQGKRGAEHSPPHEVQVYRVTIVRVGRRGEDADAESPRFVQGEVGTAEAGEIVERFAYHLSLLVPVLRRQTVHDVPAPVQRVIAGRAGSLAGHPVDEPPDQRIMARGVAARLRCRGPGSARSVRRDTGRWSRVPRSV